MDDIEIEVFRADTRASRGITAANIAEVASFDCDAHPVPNVLGHPQHDKPAIDRVRGFRAEGNVLFAKVPAAAKKIWDGIKAGEILNRSMAFFHPEHEANPTPGRWAPRHLGWLGASAPGIPGMTPLSQITKGLAFSADGETLEITAPPAEAVVFEPTPTPTFTVHDTPKPKEPIVADEKTPEQIAFEARVAEQDKREQEWAKTVRTQFESGNASIVASLVNAGRVLPAEADKLKVVFNALSQDELTFDADGKDKGTAAAALSAFIAGLPKRVPVGEERLSPNTQFQAEGIKTGRDFVARADALAKEKNISFEAAAELLDAAAE